MKATVLTSKWSERLKRLLLLAAVFWLAAGSAAWAEDEDPIAVRVGKYSYPKSLVEFTMHAAADQNGMLWEMTDQETRDAIRDAVIEQFIGIGIIENKLAEQGKHNFSVLEDELIRASAQSQYLQMWNSLYQYMTQSGVDVTQEEVSGWMESLGYTMDRFYENALASERQFRMFSLYCGDVTVSDEDVLKYYEEAFVGPDREAYENDIEAYEEKILIPGNESFFVPEGYIWVKWIQLPYPDELKQASNSLTIALNMTDAAVVVAYERLAMAAATVEDLNDLKPYREAYDAAKEENEAAGQALIEKLSEALPDALAVRDLVQKDLDAGVPFEQLVALYSKDQAYADSANPGVPFHPDSPNWTGRLRDGVLTLQKAGDLSEPVLTGDGIFLLYHAGDVPSGAHELTEDEKELVRQNALYAAQLDKLNELLAEWRNDYQIETNAAILDVSGGF